METEASQYNTATPASWARSTWQADPPGGALSPSWQNLIESFRQRAPLGQPAPDFAAELLDGGMFRLSELRGSKAVLLIFGCYACPPCVTNLNTANPNLVSLYTRYAPKGIEFIYVYTREAHPGPNFRPHDTMENKRNNAQRLQQSEGVSFPIVLDTLEGDIHRLYTDVQFNNPAFLISTAGVVVYKAAWLDSSELPQMLDEVILWDRSTLANKVVKKGYSERLRLMHEQFEPDCQKRTEHLLFHEIGISHAALGLIPGDTTR